MKLPANVTEHFTRVANDSQPLNTNQALAGLQQKTFSGWPQLSVPPIASEIGSAQFDGVRLTVYEFESQPAIPLRFYLARPDQGPVTALHIEAVDEADWRRELELARGGFAGLFQQEFALAGLNTNQPPPPESAMHLRKWTRYIRDQQAAYVTFTPRSVGLTVLSDDKKYVTQVRRRFMLLGQTLAGMQTWDLRRAIQAARQLEGLGALPLHLHASPDLTEVATFAAISEPDISSLTLAQAPRSDKEAPDFLNWSRIITPHQLLALAQARCKVNIQQRSETESR